MSYVDYDLSLYRQGYRPYGETDPFAATMLNGVKPPSRGNVFGPWRLHGIGQNPPFTPEGGYKLHGLAGAIAGFLGANGIPNGSIVTYRGTWTSVFNTGHGYQQAGDPQSIVNGVIAALAADGQLSVLQAPNNLSNSFSAVVGGVIGASNPFPVTLVLEVTNGQGFGSVNDIISIVRHYVYTISGLMPQADSIVSVQAPSDPNAAATPADLNYQAAGLLNPGGFQVPTDPSQTTAAPGTPVDFTTWIANNAGTVAAVGIGLLVGVPLLKRLF
jgi:hypothetical protein